MNKYEERAERERKASMRFSMMMWTACAALIVVVVMILGLSGSASPQFWSRAGICLAILLLVFRQIARRLKAKKPKAAMPDPRSRLNLQ
jgi:L-asparagine transporter-like permease